MKKLLLKLASAALFTVSLTTSVSAQTAGTLTVVYTPTVPSTATFYSGTRHLGAAWIETAAAAFVKTKIKFCGGNCDHLSTSTWQTASGGSTVGADVVSGATKTTFAATTFTWNGTNAAGTLMPDGNYNVKVYDVWNHGSTTNQLNTSTLAFTKGTTASTVTPAATNWIKNVTIIWKPAIVTGVNESATVNPEISVYPNPTNGVFNVDYKKANSITVTNMLGVLVYEQLVDVLSEGTKSIDLTNFANGIYFVNVANHEGSSKHKIILDK